MASAAEDNFYSTLAINPGDWNCDFKGGYLHRISLGWLTKLLIILSSISQLTTKLLNLPGEFRG